MHQAKAANHCPTHVQVAQAAHHCDRMIHEGEAQRDLRHQGDCEDAQRSSHNGSSYSQQAALEG